MRIIFLRRLDHLPSLFNRGTYLFLLYGKKQVGVLPAGFIFRDACVCAHALTAVAFKLRSIMDKPDGLAEHSFGVGLNQELAGLQSFAETCLSDSALRHRHHAA